MNMSAIMKADIIFTKTPKFEGYMKMLIDPSVHGNSEVMLASERAFENMGEGEQLVMTWKYVDYLPVLMGEPVSWRVEKAQN